MYHNTPCIHNSISALLAKSVGLHLGLAHVRPALQSLTAKDFSLENINVSSCLVVLTTITYQDNFHINKADKMIIKLHCGNSHSRFSKVTI